MGSFYQYDTRGASASDQIMTLERLLENAESEASELARRTESALVAVQALTAERDALRGLLAELWGRCILLPSFRAMPPGASDFIRQRIDAALAKGE